jgi:hypothetical protein
VNKLSELMDARDHAYLEMATAKTMAERKAWREKLEQIAREIELEQIAREIEAARREEALAELTAIAQESGDY